jgi:hypothetical protein
MGCTICSTGQPARRILKATGPEKAATYSGRLFIIHLKLHRALHLLLYCTEPEAGHHHFLIY